MSNDSYSRQQIAELGEEIFEQSVRPLIDASSEGLHVVMDISTGEYEIDRDDLTASKRLKARCPEAVMYGLRVGHPAAYHLGGLMKVVER